MAPATAPTPKKKTGLKSTCIAAFVGILTVATIIAVGALTYFSMAPSPLILPKILTGEWTVEPLGGQSSLGADALRRKSSRQMKTVSFDFTAEAKEKSKNALLDDMTLAGELNILGYTIPAGTIDMKTIRHRGASYFWAGSCYPAQHCTLLYNDFKFLFTAYNNSAAAEVASGTSGTADAKGATGKGMALSVVLSPTVVAENNIWEKKGKYLTAIVVIVVVVLRLKNILAPTSKTQRLDERIKLLNRTKKLVSGSVPAEGSPVAAETSAAPASSAST